MSIRSCLTWIISLGLVTAASAAPAPASADAPAPTAAPTGEVSNPSAGAQQELTTLEANGFKVTLDIHGFRPEYGYERISRTYFQMAVFSTADEHQRDFGGGLLFTILVDDLPKDVRNLQDLFRHFIIANKVAARQKDGNLQAMTCPPSVQVKDAK